MDAYLGLRVRDTLIFNTFWGWFMDRFGWVWPMRWFGCAVLAVGSVAFYYIPQWFGANAIMMIVASVIVASAPARSRRCPPSMTLYAGGKQARRCPHTTSPPV